MTKYVAYSDLGKGSGAPVDPAEYGGEDSDEFRYMVEHRVIVPEGDRDAPPLPSGFEVKSSEKPAEEKPAEISSQESKSEEKPAQPSGSSPAQPSGSSPASSLGSSSTQQVQNKSKPV